jgi:hypothetical protein
MKEHKYTGNMMGILKDPWTSELFIAFFGTDIFGYKPGYTSY